MGVNVFGLFHGIMIRVWGRRTWTNVCGVSWLLFFGLPFYFSSNYYVLVICFTLTGIAGAGHLLVFLEFCNDFEDEAFSDRIQILVFTMHDLSSLIFRLFRYIYEENDASKKDMQLLFLIFSLIVTVDSVLFAKIATPKKASQPTEKTEQLRRDIRLTCGTLRDQFRKSPVFRAILYATATLVLQMYFYMVPFREQMELSTDNSEAVDNLINFFGWATPIWGAASTALVNWFLLKYLSSVQWFICILITNGIWVVFTNTGMCYAYEVQYIPVILFLWWRMFVFQAIMKLCRERFPKEYYDPNLLFSLALTFGGIGQFPAVLLDKAVIFWLSEDWRLGFNVSLFVLAAFFTVRLIALLNAKSDDMEEEEEEDDGDTETRGLLLKSPVGDPGEGAV